MKKYLPISLLLIVIGTTSTITNAKSKCIGSIVNGKCHGTIMKDYSSTTTDRKQYRSLSGSIYQYDLNDPSGSLEYKLDLDAQLRDRTSINPNRRLDQSTNQYGGGIYD